MIDLFSKPCIVTKEEQDEDERLELSQVTPDVVFANFTVKEQVQNKVEAKENSAIQEEAKGQKTNQNVETIKNSHTVKEDDGEDFGVKYHTPKDTYDDLKPLQNKPLFISDLIQGLQSEDHKRFMIALSNAEGLIREQKSNDLEIMAMDLL